MNLFIEMVQSIIQICYKNRENTVKGKQLKNLFFLVLKYQVDFYLYLEVDIDVPVFIFQFL